MRSISNWIYDYRYFFYYDCIFIYFLHPVSLATASSILITHHHISVAIIGAAMGTVLFILLIAWFVYARQFPTSKSGQILIRVRFLFDFYYLLFFCYYHLARLSSTLSFRKVNDKLKLFHLLYNFGLYTYVNGYDIVPSFRYCILQHLNIEFSTSFSPSIYCANTFLKNT